MKPPLLQTWAHPCESWKESNDSNSAGIALLGWFGDVFQL